jgi:hypothetical protein
LAMYRSGVSFIVLPVKKERPGKVIELATRPDMYQICGVPAPPDKLVSTLSLHKQRQPYLT